MNEKLTAYALNELPPNEQAEFEAQLKTDPALSKEAEDMKAFCAMLQAQVADDAAALTAEQRGCVVRAFASETAGQKAAPPLWRKPSFLLPTALAACVTAMLVVNFKQAHRHMSEEGLTELSHAEATPAERVRVVAEKRDGRRVKEIPAPANPATPAILLAQNEPLALPPPPDGNSGGGAGGNSTLTGQGSAMVATKDAASAPATAAEVLHASTSTTSALTRTTADGRMGMSLPQDTPPLVLRSERGLLAKQKSEATAAIPAPAAPARASGGVAGTGMPTAPATPLAAAGPRPMILPGTLDVLEDKEAETKHQRMERFMHGAPGEAYERIEENPFLAVAQQPLSTFSLDVDTASYANVRRFLNLGQRPPADAVRLEELINYFPYNYESPCDGKPFGVSVDVAEAPWQPTHRLVRVALKGREVTEERGAANFVFLVDVSGSMDSPDKLPLVQRALEMLTRQLGDQDRVAIVTYAGSSGLVLPSTSGSDKESILDAIGKLKAGGSTNGAGGLRLAYQEAAKHFVKGGVNRVILCTDGDFNVGISSPEELEKLIAEKAKSRVFLSVLGFGTGNLKDRTMETLADKGNGNYAYIDSLSEARKVLVEQMNGTLVTIAKDVKVQVEFNPTQVSAYRLLGYENRILAKEDFNNDRKDAGEIGAGHTVTALYEIVPANAKYPNGAPLVDELKYAAKPLPKSLKEDAPAAPELSAPWSGELLTVKLRYKQPDGDKSDLIEIAVTDKKKKLAESPGDFQFAASVAGFGMLLRDSPHAGELTWDMVRDLALRGKGEDTLGYRGEFLQLIEKARGLTSSP